MIKNIDVHGLSVIETKKIINQELKNKNVTVLRIIHGYHSNVLSQMIRKQYRSHPLIDHIELSMNPGITDIILKK